MPWKRAKRVLLSSPWKTWPISWKNVTTSLCCMSAGAVGVGFARFATIAASGYEREPSRFV